MLLKCPFCGASTDHDPSAKESPVCSGCNLKLTGAILPTAAPLAPPSAAASKSASPSDVDSLLAPPVVSPTSPTVQSSSLPPAVADPSAGPPRPSRPASPADIAAPPVIHPPPVATPDAIASAPPIANPALQADPVSAESPNLDPKKESRSREKKLSETKSTSYSTSEPTPIQPAPDAASAEITPSEHTVLIPSPEGGFVPVDERFTHVEHRGKKIELLNVSHEQRHTSRRIRSSIIFVACLIFLAGFMIWLSKYLQ